MALLFVDLDEFKSVNDGFGHEEGDALLVRVSRRLLGCVRASDTVARLAGDEFVLVLPNVGSMENAVTVARKVLASFATVTLGDSASAVTASIGISRYPADAQTAEELLQHADSAMYRAKSRGKNAYALYGEERPKT